VLRDDPFVAYPGSLERVDFSEGDVVDVGAKVRATQAMPKGFYRADLVRRDGRWELDGRPEFRTVHARRFITLRVGDLTAEDPAEELARRVDDVRTAGVDLTHAFVRVNGTIDGADRARLTSAAARAIVSEAYEVLLSLDPREGSLVRDPRFARRMTEMEALERFVDSREDWSEDRDELLRLGRELVDEVLT
jgi:hypothetical protein